MVKDPHYDKDVLTHQEPFFYYLLFITFIKINVKKVASLE